MYTKTFKPVKQKKILLFRIFYFICFSPVRSACVPSVLCVELIIVVTLPCVSVIRLTPVTCSLLLFMPSFLAEILLFHPCLVSSKCLCYIDIFNISFSTLFGHLAPCFLSRPNVTETNPCFQPV